MRGLTGFLAVLVVVPWTPAPAIARQSPGIEFRRAGLPSHVVEHINAVIADSATARIADWIPPDSIIRSNAVATGTLRHAGRIEGELVVVGGDLLLEPGAYVAGDITVIDGEIRGDDLAVVAGTMTAYERTARVAVNLDSEPDDGSDPLGWPGPAPTRPGAAFAVRVTDYNRVEGLPVVVGPSFSTGGSAPFRAQTYLIWRTEGDDIPFDAPRFGYRVEVEQFLGGRNLAIGARIHSVVDPIESSGLSGLENSLSTLLFTSDQRDYFERRGWSVFARSGRRPLQADLEFRSERHGVLGPADPWSLFNSEREWRRQPLTAEGSVRSVVGRVMLDTRDREDGPRSGWYVVGEVQQAVGGSLRLPMLLTKDAVGSMEPAALQLPSFDSRFTTALLDVRRYTAIGSGAGLSVRGVVGGTPLDQALPPQYQHTLGGPGSIPGYAAFTADCGARDVQLQLARAGDRQRMYPFYGCDRFALFQAEYAGSFDFDFGFGAPDDIGGKGRGGDPRWVVFFDAGRGWAAGGWGDIPRADTPALYDAGLGLLLGGAGVYWAFPLTDDGRGSSLFVRLDRRF